MTTIQRGEIILSRGDGVIAEEAIPHASASSRLRVSHVFLQVAMTVQAES